MNNRNNNDINEAIIKEYNNIVKDDLNEYTCRILLTDLHIDAIKKRIIIFILLLNKEMVTQLVENALYSEVKKLI